MIELLKRSGSKNREIAAAATVELLEALELPLREAVFSGDNLGGIFEVIPATNSGNSVEFPLDVLAPGSEKDFVGFTLPKAGAIPTKQVDGDYVTVPTYEVGHGISWLRKYARQARWDIVGRCMEVLEAGMTKKRNDDGWHTLLAAGVDRNVLVFDGDAAAGQFTKRLVSLMKVIMRRNGGGNSTSINRQKLTDLYVSVEAMEDVRNWNVDQLDEVSRREIYVAEDGAVNKIFGVFIHDMDELGEGQEYQDFFTNVLSGAMASGDVELVVGLNQAKKGSFVHPVASELTMYPDESLGHHRRAGALAEAEWGFAALSNRQVVLGSL